MNEREELDEARFLYACASMKVALASFAEVCEVYGGVEDEVFDALDGARRAIDALTAS